MMQIPADPAIIINSLSNALSSPRWNTVWYKAGFIDDDLYDKCREMGSNVPGSKSENFPRQIQKISRTNLKIWGAMCRGAGANILPGNCPCSTLDLLRRLPLVYPWHSTPTLHSYDRLDPMYSTWVTQLLKKLLKAPPPPTPFSNLSDIRHDG